MKSSDMKIAVNGASGYTGKLAVAELARRNIDAVLVGRDIERLREAGDPGAELRLADINNPSALVDAFLDCDVVVNCAGPFSVLGKPVVRAAITAGCHYVDTTGEQHYIKRIFDTFAEDAEAAGVSVVPALAEDGGPSDLISRLTAERVEPIDELTIALWYRDGGVTRGTMRSMLAVIDKGALRYENGDWLPDPSSGPTSMTFPGSTEEIALATLALPPVVTVPRHVTARRVQGVVNADLVAGLSGITQQLIDSAPKGPAEEIRRAHKWTAVADAVGIDGRTARGVVEGTDGYGTTAVIAVEGARRLVVDGAKPGVLAPSQAFDAAGFLNFLAPHGVRWSTEDTVDTGAR